MNLKHALLLTATILLLQSCGWQLRGYQPGSAKVDSSKLQTLDVLSENRNNAFYRVLRATLKKRGLIQTKDSDIKLALEGEELRRQPLTYSRTGVPAQYQLSLSVDYEVNQNDIVLVEQRRIVSRRNYDFDPDLIIAKDREEEELLEEMRIELAERIITSIHRAL